MNYVFDFGGVLFQWRPVPLLQGLLPQRALGDDAAAALARELFSGDWGEFDRGTVEPAQLVLRLAARTGLSEAELQRIVDGVPAHLRPLDDGVALLRRLRDAGQGLYFLSNMPAPYADELERLHPFIGWFRAGLFSARVRQIKPEPGIFALAQQHFGVPANTLVFFDDHPANVQAARAAGWQALHYTGAAACEAELKAQGLWPAGA